MKTLLRLLWLTLGLIYRLIVLLLFNRWLPFPQKGDEQRGAKRGPVPASGRQAQPIFSPGAAASGKRALMPADLVQQFLEGLQMEEVASDPTPLEPPAPVKPARPPRHPRPAEVVAKAPHRASYGGSIASLSRDKRALRDAILLGSALGKRRGPFGG